MKVKLDSPEFSGTIAPMICGYAAYRAQTSGCAEIVNEDEDAIGWPEIAAGLTVKIPEITFAELKALADEFGVMVRDATPVNGDARMAYPRLVHQDGKVMLRARICFEVDAVM